MEYVSAEWVDVAPGQRMIKALGDDGQEYWIPEANTDVPPWPDFLVKHGLKAIKGQLDEETANPKEASEAGES